MSRILGKGRVMTEITFKTSSFCQDGGCVGAHVGEAEVTVRDEKNPAHGVITVPRAAWVELTAALKRGELGSAP